MSEEPAAAAPVGEEDAKAAPVVEAPTKDERPEQEVLLCTICHMPSCWR